MKTREEYIQQAKLKLEQLDAKIKIMEAELAIKKIDVKAAWRTQLADMKRKRTEAAQKLDSIKATTGEAWHTLKEGLDHILDEVHTTYQKTKEVIKK